MVQVFVTLSHKIWTASSRSTSFASSSPARNGFRPTDNSFHPQLTENGSPLQFTEEAAGKRRNLSHPAGNEV